MPRHTVPAGGALGYQVIHPKEKAGETTTTDAEAKARHLQLDEESRTRRLAPRQFLSPKWPQLQYGAVPEVDIKKFWFKLKTVDGEVDLTYGDLLDVPRTHITGVDFHCVTGWSILDADFEGIRALELFRYFRLDPGCFTRLFSTCLDGFTGSLPKARAKEAWVVTHAYGKELEPKHGYPVRLVVPDLYGFKSAKWITELYCTPEDRLGFWEIRGYDDSANPWLEERFAGATGKDGLTAAQRAKHNLKKEKHG